MLLAESFIGLGCDVVTIDSPATNAKIVAQSLDPNFENEVDEVKDNVKKVWKFEPRHVNLMFLFEDAFETL